MPGILWARRSARLAQLGVVAQLRNPALRLVGLIGAVSAAAFAWNRSDVAASTALVLAVWLGRAYGIAACLWFAYAAVRDQNEREGAVLRSKPVDGAHWVLVTWAAGAGLWLLLLGLAFLGAALVQLPYAGLLALESHGLAFARAALAVGSAGTLSFALSRLMCSPLGGIIIMFAWFCAMAGFRYIPAYLQPDYTQNFFLFLSAAALLLCLAALVVERFRRGELRRPLLAALAILVLALLSAGGAASAYREAPRLAMEEPTLWERISRQHLLKGQRVPGFWLPDGKGGLVRTSDHRGQVLLIYLFAADDLDAARTLSTLDAVGREYRDRGVQPLGVCLSMDHSDGWALVHTGGYHFPIGYDPATVKTSEPPESPVAVAYDAHVLPMLVVTDRRRRVQQMLTDPSYEVEYLRQVVDERLAAEPE